MDDRGEKFYPSYYKFMEKYGCHDIFDLKTQLTNYFENGIYHSGYFRSNSDDQSLPSVVEYLVENSLFKI